MIRPEWPAPARVRAVVTQTVFTPEQPGFSQPPYGHFNLARHVGEAPEVVNANRRLLSQQLGIGPVQWLDQVHGVEVHRAQYTSHSSRSQIPSPVADAIYTATPQLPIAVLTADCLPVMFCSYAGDEIAVAHAGWRGLAQGVLAQTVNAFTATPERLMAYLGPAISPEHFEVGEEVRQAFVTAFQSYGASVESCFISSLRSGHYRADLYGLARLQLNALGVQAIFGGTGLPGSMCTFSDPRFYSYRRALASAAEGVCGRMASMLWLDS